ncbi:pentapeptide repeat-containing protein [Pseudomonas japonica]|uniref:pentapeptide repeat-containing protein n=1 Tax=Pseudomonas japonica TaxID=256466 RepID=UPI00382ED21F
MSPLALAVFMGKFSFSAPAQGRKAGLAVLERQDSEQAHRYFPAMLAEADAALVSVYQLPDGSARLQIEQRWIGIDPTTGNLILNSDLAAAATLRLTGERPGQAWEVLVEGNWQPVVFCPQASPALLTIARENVAESRFEPTRVTPSLAMLTASRQGRGVDLSHVVLDGASVIAVDFSEARFTGASLRDADFSGCTLTAADFREARLDGVSFDGAVLDGADLTGVFALKASLKQCSLKHVRAGNANFTAANFSDADLHQAQLDAKVWLFSLSLSHAENLDRGQADEALLALFRDSGIALPPGLAIRTLAPGRRWQLGERNAGYLLFGTHSAIDVFQIDPSVRPAVLYKAICTNTRASGAHLGGVDLRAVQWCGEQATLDHADLDEAVLSNSLLVSLDLSRAFLSGADLSGSVLVDARIAGCTLQADGGSRVLSLEGAQIQGVDFSDSTLVDARLINACVSLEQGVPLFTLPPSVWDDLGPAGLAVMAPRFAMAGYPLGAAPSLDLGRFWSLEDRDRGDSPVYRVREIDGQLQVFEGEEGTEPLFVLPWSVSFSLEREHPDVALIAEFQAVGYGLSATANISAGEDPQVRPSASAGIVGPFGYSRFRLARRGHWVQVFGMGPLLMRDWPLYPSGVAFNATGALAAALSEHSIGPAGYLKQALSAGILDSEAFFTAMPRLS